jgi:hypothetical protein
LIVTGITLISYFSAFPSQAGQAPERTASQQWFLCFGAQEAKVGVVFWLRSLIDTLVDFPKPNDRRTSGGMSALRIACGSIVLWNGIIRYPA